MATNSGKSNRVEVPEAKAALERFKTEVASELGVNLKEGYNGDLTSKEAGSIGGEMVRRMIKKQARALTILVDKTAVPRTGCLPAQPPLPDIGNHCTDPPIPRHDPNTP